jgi:hypothetical protein
MNMIGEFESPFYQVLEKHVYELCMKYIKREAKRVGYTRLMLACQPWDEIPASHWIDVGNKPGHGVCSICAYPELRDRGQSGFPIIWRIVDQVNERSPFKFKGGGGNGHQVGISGESYHLMPKGYWRLENGKWKDAWD